MQIKKFVCLILLTFATLSISAQSVGLVLSGGGAKGLSHVGVIKALEENNIPIDYIAGTSMGAIVAGLYSIGLTPDEMLSLFRSKEFESWYNGQQEQAFASYLYRRDATAEMFGVTFSKDKNDKLSMHLPSSLVSPFPMDLAVIQIFGSPAAAAHYDFDKLMIPFRCVASDATRKRPLVMRNGDLGASIRASMCFPVFFKPIMIDSTLLFDGGIYNNFPWDVMISDFNPDFIIGSKCAGNYSGQGGDDMVSQIESMLTVETDYKIPEEKGMIIDTKFTDVSLLDFDRVDEIVRAGYFNTMKIMPQLKERIEKRETPDSLLQKRLAFRTKCLPLKFEKVIIQDKLRSAEKQYIDRTIWENRNRFFDFEQLKRGYYRIISSGNVKDLYPVTRMTRDSVFNVVLKAKEAPPMRIAIGGNISSSSLNQGYVGVEYRKFSLKPWKVAADVNLGRFYLGFNAYWRQDFSIRPMAFYEVQFTVHNFDYFGSSQTNLFSNNVPAKTVQEGEIFWTGSVATPVNLYSNLLAKFSLNIGRNRYEYYHTEKFTTYDIPDKTNLSLISPSIQMERNTTNYRMYPTEGRIDRISLRYTHLSQDYRPGTTAISGTDKINNASHNAVAMRFFTQSYQKLGKNFTLGWLADITASTQVSMGDRTSTLMFLPAFQPNPHSRTLLLYENRAPSYMGIALMPVIHFTKNLYLYITGSYFQPYRQLLETTDASTKFSDKFPRGAFSADFAAVLQSPIGPITLSASYYEKSDIKWFPQLNIGFLVYKPKALSN